MRFFITTLAAVVLLFSFVACGDDDPTVVGADPYKTVELTATFPMQFCSGVTNGTVDIVLPYLTGSATNSSEEQLVDLVLTFSTTNYAMKGLYTPSKNRVVAATTISTNAYDINCTISGSSFSGVVSRTVADSDPIVYIDSGNFAGTAQTVTRSVKR